MGKLAKIREKLGKSAPALAAAGVIGTVGLSAMATGDVSAATENGGEVVEATKWLGMSVLGWVGTAITAGFGGALLYFRDVRLAIPTVLMLIATAGIVHFGL